MPVVDIDENVYKEIRKLTDEHPADYPSIRNFVFRTLKEKLLGLGINVEMSEPKENNKNGTDAETKSTK